jgi:hypothetical protein
MSSSANAGETVRNGLCFPVYQAIDSFAHGDGFEGATTLACPVGVGAIAQGVKAGIEGDWEKAAGKAGQAILEPFGFGAGSGGKAAGEAIYREATAKDEEKAEEKPLEQTDPLEEEKRKATEEPREARIAAATADDAAKRAAYMAARQSGANRAQAQALSNANSPTGNQSNMSSNLRSASGMTQNDWLMKQGYANALAREANNLKAGAGLNTLGAIFGGAGQGASTGAGIGSSLGGGK